MTILMTILAFALGMATTWFWAVRTAHREIPADVARALWGVDDEPELYDQEDDVR